ncbi:hypothetical protein [Falsiroseomonas tokyonensis]|uniref:Uncharacterized protein n=1 Tax=Falsiroseomonas tokyonensis TaxID=430521 RepID=A0ABV7BT89_9PROT|nr:hypothetical protein [Falsiroseomonas tokyonensis]MBU8538728.1 hypothetical protein [Falsiroseomonas tokyonensis]
MTADHPTTARGRRAVLRGGAALIAASPGIACAASEPDAELLALAQRWRSAWACFESACDAYAVAERHDDRPATDAASARMHGELTAIAAVEQAMAAAPAIGAAGLAVKAALLSRIFLGPTEPRPRHDDLARSLAADARRLVPCAPEVEA